MAKSHEVAVLVRTVSDEECTVVRSAVEGVVAARPGLRMAVTMPQFPGYAFVYGKVADAPGDQYEVDVDLVAIERVIGPETSVAALLCGGLGKYADMAGGAL
jgi:hypothetical protein